MRTSPDPYFGGVEPEPMARNLSGLMGAMYGGEYDIGFAADGDADRLGVVGPDGGYIMPHKVMGLLLLHLSRNRGLSGKVARTVSMSSLIDRIAAKLGLEVIETPVGFKNICGYMLDGGLLIGGEENGGLGVKGYLPERDGLLGALLLLEMMAVEKKGILELLSDMESEFGGSFYERCDVRVSTARTSINMEEIREDAMKAFAGSGIISVNRLDGLKLGFTDGSWILFRLSGTEPVIRIYCESESPDTVREIVGRAMEVLIGQGSDRG
jgi:phosphomannomutase